MYGEALSDRPEDDPRYPVLYYIVFYRKGNSFTYLVQKFASTLTAVIQSLYIVNKSQTRTFSRILQSHKMYLLAQFFGHFCRSICQTFLPFHILQQTKSLPFYIPDVLKWYPFRVCPTRLITLLWKVPQRGIISQLKRENNLLKAPVGGKT